MINQIETGLWFKLNGFLRYVLAHSSSFTGQHLVVNEYPKSGGSWIGEMLSDVLGVPFPRNRLPMLRSCILHGHMMQSWGVGRAVIVWRDGRDVLVSQYYHSLFYNDRGNRRLVDQTRAALKFDDFSDIRKNLPAFMDYVYNDNRHPRASWSEFVDYWAARDQFCHVKYEFFRSDPVAALEFVVNALGVDGRSPERLRTVVHDHSFEVKSGRKAGEESNTSFMRKGVVGDWENHFSLEARQKFCSYAGKQLIRLGYESDDSWVERGAPGTSE